MEKKKKLIYIEALRIIAAFFVIFNHTAAEGFFLFSKCETGSIQFWVYMLVSIFCKFSVPMFFMLSGALMLVREDEPLSITFKKRILKIAVILITFSFFYYVDEIIHNPEAQISFNKFFKRLYSSNLKFHLWYLYLYIAYLAVLPFLKALVKGLDNKYFYYMMGISVFFVGLLPCAEYLSEGGGNIKRKLKDKLDNEFGRALPMSWILSAV